MTSQELKELHTLKDEVTKLYIRVMDFEQSKIHEMNNEQVSHIVNVCLKRWDVSLTDLMQKGRERTFVYRRMLLGYLLIKYTGLQRQEVAKMLGYKNHASVNHITYAMENLMFTDIKMRTEFKELLKLLDLQK